MEIKKNRGDGKAVSNCVRCVFILSKTTACITLLREKFTMCRKK